MNHRDMNKEAIGVRRSPENSAAITQQSSEDTNPQKLLAI